MSAAVGHDAPSFPLVMGLSYDSHILTIQFMTLSSGETKGKGRMEKSIYTPEYAALLRVLKAARQEAGMTQIELAGKLSLTQSLFSKMERGECRIDLVQLRTICSHVGLTATQFVQRWERELKKKK